MMGYQWSSLRTHSCTVPSKDSACVLKNIEWCIGVEQPTWVPFEYFWSGALPHTKNLCWNCNFNTMPIKFVMLLFSIELPSHLPRLIVINMKNDFILLRTLEFLLDDRTNNNCCASDWSILNITCTYLHCTFPKCRNLDFLSLWGMVWDRVFP